MRNRRELASPFSGPIEPPLRPGGAKVTIPTSSLSKSRSPMRWREVGITDLAPTGLFAHSSFGSSSASWQPFSFRNVDSASASASRGRKAACRAVRKKDRRKSRTSSGRLNARSDKHRRAWSTSYIASGVRPASISDRAERESMSIRSHDQGKRVVVRWLQVPASYPGRVTGPSHVASVRYPLYSILTRIVSDCAYRKCPVQLDFSPKLP